MLWHFFQPNLGLRQDEFLYPIMQKITNLPLTILTNVQVYYIGMFNYDSYIIYVHMHLHVLMIFNIYN